MIHEHTILDFVYLPMYCLCNIKGMAYVVIALSICARYKANVNSISESRRRHDHPVADDVSD
jgi:hypothetical protein